MDYAQARDEELVVRLAQRDERALERLYDRYGRATYSLLLRMLRDPARAEEAAQEVFLKVWRSPASYDPARGPFATWLLSVAHHRAVDDLRARRYETTPIDALDGGAPQLVDQGRDLADLAWLSERRVAVRQALSALPAAQRQALELAYFGGLTQREIADRLGEPLGTIKTRMRLALQKLKGALIELAPGGTPANGHAAPGAAHLELGRADV